MVPSSRPPLHSVAALAIGSDRAQGRGSQGDWGWAHVWPLMVVAQRRLGGFRHKKTRPGVVDRRSRPRSRLPRGAGNWTGTRLAAIKLHRLRVLGTEAGGGGLCRRTQSARSCAGGLAKHGTHWAVTTDQSPSPMRHLRRWLPGAHAGDAAGTPPLPQTSARGRSQAVGRAVGGGLSELSVGPDRDNSAVWCVRHGAERAHRFVVTPLASGPPIDGCATWAVISDFDVRSRCR